MSPFAPDASVGPEPDPASGSAVQTVGALNRFLGALVQEAWDDLDRALRITESTPDFSGILPLGDPSLLPYLDRPGVFFILGPHPHLPLLHIGASRGPVGPVLMSRLERCKEGSWVWRWEKRSDPPPTFAAVATMMDHWAFAPPLRDLLARRLDFEGAGTGGLEGEVRRAEKANGPGAGEGHPT
jgi:hypothetical protein